MLKRPWGLIFLSLPPLAQLSDVSAQYDSVSMLELFALPHEDALATQARGVARLAEIYGGQRPALDAFEDATRGHGAPPSVVLCLAGMHTAVAVCRGLNQHALLHTTDPHYSRNSPRHATEALGQVLRARGDGPWCFADSCFALPAAQSLHTMAASASIAVSPAAATTQLRQRLLDSAPTDAATLAQQMVPQLMAVGNGTLLPPDVVDTALGLGATASAVWRKPSGELIFGARSVLHWAHPKVGTVEICGTTMGPWDHKVALESALRAAMMGLGVA